MAATDSQIGIAKKLEGARGLVSDARYNEAKTLLENTIAKVEDSDDFTPGECFEFSGPIEQILYIHRNAATEPPKQAAEPVASLYTTYGKLLLGLGESFQAREAFDTALEYNPVSATIQLERAEACRIEGDMDRFFEENIKVFPDVHDSADLARIYGNLGFYYVEKEMWKEAMGCYLMSLHYDSKNEDAKKEIAYIQEQTKGEAGVPSIDEFREVASKHDIPVGPSDEVVGIAASYGHKALSDGRKDVAHYFLRIVFDLTGDEEIYNTLEKIEQEMSTEE